MVNVIIRKGEKKDCPIIIKLIRELRTYNGAPNASALTSKDLEIGGFGESSFFRILVAEVDTHEGKQIVGYALYYISYSSFEGPSSFIEDIFITEKYRHRYIGGALLKALVKDLMETGCIRVDFSVGEWNHPAIQFYRKHGAINLSTRDNWSFFRIEKENMTKMAENSKITIPTPCKIGIVESKSMGQVSIRKGEKMDCAAILENLILLSHYNGDPDGVKIDVKTLQEDGFGEKRYYRSFVVEQETAEGKEIIGVAIYVLGYSCYVARSSYLEAIFIKENFRFHGLGSVLLKNVIQDLLDSGCNGLDFAVLNWNKPSIKFYEKQGAVNRTERDGWQFYRFDIGAMKKLSLN